jgi:putative membrane protein
LGLFILVINGLLFYAVGSWLEGFEVKTFLDGMIGALLYCIFSWVLSALLIDNK